MTAMNMHMTHDIRTRTIGAATLLAAVILAIVAMATAVTAIPPVAAEFYGTVTLDGIPAATGTNITITNAAGIVCGRQAMTKQGEFGLLSCNGDDPSTAADEGAQPGETILLVVNDRPAANATWHEGDLNRIALAASTRAIVTRRLESTGLLPGAFIIPGIAVLLAIATYVYLKKGDV